MHKKLSTEFCERWDHLLSEVNKDDVPIEYIERLELHFNDGRPSAYIDVIELLRNQSPNHLEEIISTELANINDHLERVDFHLNVQKVVHVVNTATNEFLKDI